MRRACMSVRYLEINAGIAGRCRRFAREGELPHLAVSRAVIDLQHGLRPHVSNDVLALAVHAAECDLAAGHDGELVPTEAASAGHSALAARADLAAPVALADHEGAEGRVALLHEDEESLVAFAAVGDSRDRHMVRIASLGDQLVQPIKLRQG